MATVNVLSWTSSLRRSQPPGCGLHSATSINDLSIDIPHVNRLSNPSQLTEEQESPAEAAPCACSCCISLCCFLEPWISDASGDYNPAASGVLWFRFSSYNLVLFLSLSTEPPTQMIIMEYHNQSLNLKISQYPYCAAPY